MKFKQIALVAAMSMSALFSVAQATTLSDTQKKQITDKLTKVNPQVEVVEISTTPWDNVVEVVMKGNQIVYTSPDGKFLMANDGRDMILLDVEAKRNLTEDKLAKLNRIDVSKIDKNNAILLQKGKLGEIHVFADPNCIYCKRYEQTLGDVKDVTVYLHLYPILNQDSVQKAHQVWCAENKVEAWKDWMLNGKPLPTKTDCDTSSVKKSLEFGQSVGIQGTPTTIFSDGTRIPGAISPAALMKKINSISENK